MTSDQQCVANTDRELWREREGDYYADSIHVTAQGAIGINCGGYVYTKPMREWFKLAGGPFPAVPAPVTSKYVVDPKSLREMADDCESFNNTPPIHAQEYQRLYLRVTRYAPRYLREAAEQLEQMTAPSFADRLRKRVEEIREGLGAGSLSAQSSIERWYGDLLLDAVLDAIDEEFEARQ